MAYEKQVFSDGQILTADHLNHIEEGLEALGKNLPTEIQTITDNALTEAKESGEFDGVSVTSVEQITTSSEDGGSNVIKVTLSNGVSSTFTVKNGGKGSQGVQGIQGIQGENGKDGSNGKDGATGATGVGVKSVTQTTTSTADGGSNVVTVTLTDGTTSTFTFKNGSKGSTGDKGDTGEVDYSRLDNYLPLSGGTLTDNLYLGAGAIPASNYGAVLGTDNLRFFQLFGGEYYFANVDASYNSPYKFGMYQWDDNFTFVTRWAAGNSFYKDAWQINGETAVTNFTERPTVQGAGVALQSEIPSVPTLKTETWTFTLGDGSTVTKVVYTG